MKRLNYAPLWVFVFVAFVTSCKVTQKLPIVKGPSTQNHYWWVDKENNHNLIDLTDTVTGTMEINTLRWKTEQRTKKSYDQISEVMLNITTFSDRIRDIIVERGEYAIIFQQSYIDKKIFLYSVSMKVGAHYQSLVISDTFKDITLMGDQFYPRLVMSSKSQFEKEVVFFELGPNYELQPAPVSIAGTKVTQPDEKSQRVADYVRSEEFEKIAAAIAQLFQQPIVMW